MRAWFAHLLILALLAPQLPGCAAEARGRKARLRPGTLDLRHVNTKERVNRLRMFTGSDPRKRRVSKRAHKVFRHYLRDWRRKKSRPVPERLIWNLYLVAHHFDRPLEIVSGYRSKERRTSRHRKALAVDFRVQGVDPKAVWEYCKTRFPRVGLGYYPTSRFVHMDLRSKSYFWIDDSGPGEEAKYREGVSQKRPKKAKRRKRAKRSRKKAKRSRKQAKRSRKKAKRSRKKAKRAPKKAKRAPSKPKKSS